MPRRRASSVDSRMDHRRSRGPGASLAQPRKEVACGMPRARTRRDPPAGDTTSRVPVARNEDAAAAVPAARARGALIVEDGATTTAEQMTKSDFLSALR